MHKFFWHNLRKRSEILIHKTKNWSFHGGLNLFITHMKIYLYIQIRNSSISILTWDCSAPELTKLNKFSVVSRRIQFPDKLSPKDADAPLRNLPVEIFENIPYYSGNNERGRRKFNGVNRQWWKIRKLASSLKIPRNAKAFLAFADFDVSVYIINQDRVKILKFK